MLTPEQREVVHLHVFDGLTFREIAEASGASINTVAARYRYALAKLRVLLDGVRPDHAQQGSWGDAAAVPACSSRGLSSVPLS